VVEEKLKMPPLIQPGECALLLVDLQAALAPGVSFENRVSPARL
jgi:hypothetical protein